MGREMWETRDTRACVPACPPFSPTTRRLGPPRRSRRKRPPQKARRREVISQRAEWGNRLGSPHNALVCAGKCFVPRRLRWGKSDIADAKQNVLFLPSERQAAKTENVQGGEDLDQEVQAYPLSLFLSGSLQVARGTCET